MESNWSDTHAEQRQLSLEKVALSGKGLEVLHMFHGNALGAHVQLSWETPPNSFGANAVGGLGPPATAGSSESKQNMGSYDQTTIFKQG